MPKLKITDEDLDVEELENAEVRERDYEPYDGPEPPKGTILRGYVKKLWWTYTQNDDAMLIALFIAADNVGTRAKYNNWASFDRIALTAAAKFRWKPFLDAFGLTIREVKTKTFVEADAEGNMGDPITKIGTWKPGEDEDGAWARVLIKVETGEYAGSKIDTWMEYGEQPVVDADEDEDEEEVPDDQEIAEEEEPEDEDEVEDETEGEEEEEEEPDPPAKPARGGRHQSSATTTRATSTRVAKPAAKPAAKAPAATARRGAARPAGKTSATATSKPAARGRGGRRSGDDDPPF